MNNSDIKKNIDSDFSGQDIIRFYKLFKDYMEYKDSLDIQTDEIEQSSYDEFKVIYPKVLKKIESYYEILTQYSNSVYEALELRRPQKRFLAEYEKLESQYNSCDILSLLKFYEKFYNVYHENFNHSLKLKKVFTFNLKATILEEEYLNIIFDDMKRF